jgi:hypothetical protein
MGLAESVLDAPHDVAHAFSVDFRPSTNFARSASSRRTLYDFFDATAELLAASRCDSFFRSGMEILRDLAHFRCRESIVIANEKVSRHTVQQCNQLALQFVDFRSQPDGLLQPLNSLGTR